MLNNVLTSGGNWEYVPGFTFDTTETATLKAFTDAWDFVSAGAFLESVYSGSWTSVALFQNAAFTHTLENEQVLESDSCSVGEAAKFVTKTPSFSVDLFETDNIDLFAQALGLTTQTVAAAPVGPTATTQTSGTWNYSVPFRVGSPKGATSVVIATVAGGTDGALVLNTDYLVSTDSEGYETITIIDSATVTTESQDITFDLTYTPLASKLTGYCVASATVPYNLFKFTSCPNQVGEVNIYYAYKFSLNTDYAMTFANLDRDGQSFVSSSIGFEGAKGGVWFYNKGTVTSY